MRLRLTVTFSPRAKAHYKRARKRWREEHPDEPGHLREDVHSGLELIATYPSIGGFAPNVRRPDIRRVVLQRVRYDLYYRVSDTGIEIVAVRHHSRGALPGL